MKKPVQNGDEIVRTMFGPAGSETQPVPESVVPTDGRLMTGDKARAAVFSALTGESSEGMFIADLGGSLVYTNRAFAEMHGHESAEPLIGRRLSSLHEPGDCLSIEKIVRGIDDTGKYCLEDVHDNAEGVPFTSLLCCHEYRDESGNRAGVIGILRDISEQKKTEQTLLKMENERTAILDSITDLVTYQDTDLRVVWVNRAAETSVGANASSLVGRYCYEIWHQQSEPCDECPVLKAMQEGRTCQGEISTPDGRQWSLAGHPFRDEEGNIVGAVEVCRDITESKNVERELHESEERYRTVVEHSNDGVAIVKGDDFLFLNQRFVEMFGFDIPADLLGRSINTVVHEDERERVSELSLRRQRGEEASQRYEFKGTKKDGTSLYVEVSAVRTLYQGETVSLAFLRDVTDRHRAEEALRASEDKYRTVVENSKEGIVIIQDRCLRFINPRACQVTGYDKDELLSKEFSLLIHPDDREMVEKHHRLRMTGKPVPPVYTFRILNKEGVEMWMEINAVIVEWDGKPAALCFINDITERKRLEEQLRHSQKMEAVGRLAGGVAHDFNNLLTAITGYSSLMISRMAPGDPRRSEAEEILKAGERAAALTEQLLVFSRRHVSKPKVVDLNVVVTNLENMLCRLIGEDVELSTAYEEQLHAVKVDPANMEQVIVNLAVNARDAMPDGGGLIIRTENVSFDTTYCKYNSEARPGDFVRLIFEDTGVGMESGVIDHIFEPFYTTKRVGTGLGLSVVYGIIKQHDGWVDVYSEPDRGSKFMVYLPVFSVAPREQQTEIPEQIEAPRGKGERVLLVEDEPGVREFVEQVLRDNGYEVFSAGSSSEALQIFEVEGRIFHLVFSDVVLPDMTGPELVDTLLGRNPDLKILLSSGYTDHKSQWREIDEKGYHFQQKPYTTVEILRKIHDILAVE